MRINPFQETIQVTGDGYIGRHETISYLKNILSKNSKDSGVVISGLTRMGKTSLVKKCFIEAEKNGDLKNNNIVTVSLTVSTIRDFSEFLRKLSDEINSALDDEDYLTDKLEEMFEKAEKAHKSESDRIYEQDRILRKIFRHLNKKAGIKLVILLDEFDDASRTFNYPGEILSTNFQKFRDYASDADYNITFILTCRTRISQIDESLPSGSNLRGVFAEKVLIGFSDDEREEFFDKIKKCGVELNELQKERMIWYAGRSPFLFSKIACGILSADENIKSDEINIEEIFKGYRNDFNDYFDSLIDFMKREEQHSKIIQIFFGPKYDLTEKDVERLKDYGYIYHDTSDKKFMDLGYIEDNQEDENGNIFTYQTLSEYFVEYMRISVNQDSSIKIWSDLIEAERNLRNLVEQGLKEEFGKDNWIEKLREFAVSEEKGFLYNVKTADKFINDSRTNFGDVVDDNPLSVININSLGNIISAFWNNRYSSIFKPPYDEIQMLINELNRLNRARNPLAHGTPEYLSASDKQIVVEYCNKINQIGKNGV